MGLKTQAVDTGRLGYHQLTDTLNNWFKLALHPDPPSPPVLPPPVAAMLMTIALAGMGNDGFEMLNVWEPLVV
ncbi:MAG: hypothetical protein WB783_13925 [Arenicellales bacterium]